MKIKIFLLVFFIQTLAQAQSVIINEVVSSNSIFEDEDGDTPDWIEIYNPQDTSISLHNYSLTDDSTFIQKWIFPEVNLASNSYLIVFASDKNRISPNLHTNFKISSAGERIILSDPSGTPVDEVDSVIIPTDYSLGRNYTNLSEWLIYPIPTPGEANTTEGYAALSEEPIFSIEGGFHSSGVSVTLSTLSGIAEIYYTLDGSDPTINSTEYTSAIIIDDTKVLRVRSFEEGILPSKIITKTYFINENYSLPVVSLSTNPANFFDNTIGIYVTGTNGIIGYCSDVPRNFNQDWERPIHVEFFEPNGNLGFSIDAGVKIDGSCSRVFPQKTLRIISRGSYGSNNIPYKIFPDVELDQYYSFLLRNSGNDIARTFFRDALMHEIVKDLDLETMAYRPAIVLLNGNYWGIHNIREKTNTDYLAQYHDVDKNQIDLLSFNHTILEGDDIHYVNMCNYILNNNMSTLGNYNYIKTQMDVDNYISYLLSELYCANGDWYAKNTKFWRPRTQDGKWRWILFDTDWSFGLYDSEQYKTNMLDLITDDTKYPARIFNGLIQNEEFKNQFINTFADYANTIFKSEKVNALIDFTKSRIELEMPNHIQRWNLISSMENWGNYINRVKNFVDLRLGYMKTHFKQEFGLGEITSLVVNINDSLGGKIQLNTINIDEFPWSGEYFQTVPIQLKAIPSPGYSFVGWSGSIVSTEEEIIYLPTLSNDITANFSKNPPPPDVVINEINYNSNINFEVGDWVELYNNTEEDVDLSNWYFSDEDDLHKYYIPEGTIFGSKNYIVLSEEDSIFSIFFPDVNNIIGDLGFGLSGGGEAIRLYSNDHQLVDTLEYDDISPWPVEADGSGPTLELRNPDLDNLVPINWKASKINYGTPGQRNSRYETDIDLEIKIYLEGAYDQVNDMMNVNIGQTEGFPKNQPFIGTPWEYGGEESIENVPNAEIVDWVLVELREDLGSSTKLKQQAALLKQDGSIVGLNGTSNLLFDQVPIGSYYIVVYHRNHLSVISQNKISVD